MFIDWILRICSQKYFCEFSIIDYMEWDHNSQDKRYSGGIADKQKINLAHLPVGGLINRTLR